MLEHADRRDLVEAAVELGIGFHLDGDAVFQTLGADAFARERGLRFRQRDAVADDAVVLGRMDKHRAPAAADVEQPLARLQPELAADMVELVGLRLVDAVGEIGEIAAAVDHAFVEEEPVEVIRDVVVMLDRFLVGAADERVAAGKFVGPSCASRRKQRRQVAQELQLRQGLSFDLSLPSGRSATMSNSVPSSTSTARETHSSTKVVTRGRRTSLRIASLIIDLEERSGRRPQALAVPKPHRKAGLQRFDDRADDPCRSLLRVHAFSSSKLRRRSHHSGDGRPLKPILPLSNAPAVPAECAPRPLSFQAQDPIMLLCSTNRKEVIRCRVISFTRAWPQRIAFSGSSLPDQRMTRGL